MNRLIATSPIDIMITTSGRIFTPGVSSSKKRSRPALAAGIGASRFLLFSRPLDKFEFHSLFFSPLRELNIHFDSTERPLHSAYLDVLVSVLCAFEAVVNFLKALSESSHIFFHFARFLFVDDHSFNELRNFAHVTSLHADASDF
jgi:hypothetical protein